MHSYICEFIGTAMLVLLGDGVVSNVSLNKSGMKGGGTIQITIAWGFAVLVPAMIFGISSGAHFNPALTLALAADGSFPWAMVPGYVISQLAGGFLGAVVVWIMYLDHFNATEEAEVIRGCFCTAPTIRNIPLNIFSEMTGTFVLVFAIKGIAQAGNLDDGISYFFVFAIICAIGMSLGGTTGYAINPARDLGPRLVYALMPLKHKGSPHWDYAMVPVVGPIIGALLAVLLYNAVF